MLEHVGHYTVVRSVGRGGLGVVYRALDERTGRVVALKLLHRTADDDVASRRLSREFKALSVIRHPNIVRVLDAGVHDGAPWLAMEFVDGLLLRAYIDLAEDGDELIAHPPARAEPAIETQPTPGGHVAVADEPSGPDWLWRSDEPDSDPGLYRRRAADDVQALDASVQAALNRPARVLRLRDAVAQICDALAFVHAQGLVHRDIKPGNVLVQDDGRAKLVDFGLVKARSSSGNTTAAGHVVGTYRYMSPEQARGETVDGRSDLYGVGCVLYEMLCGHPPFTQPQTMALLQAIVNTPAPPLDAINPGVDPALADVAMKLLRKHPDERCQRAEDVARLLRAPLR